MQNLLTLKYWFTTNPEPLIPLALNLLLGFVILLVVLAIVFSLAKKRNKLYKRVYQKLYDFSFTNVIIGIFFIFFHHEHVPFFSARFWLALWLIGMIVWLVFTLKGLKKIPERKKELEKTKEFNKYIP